MKAFSSSLQKAMMTDDIPLPVAAGPLAVLAERLIYLKQRARHCRRVAQACDDPALAKTLEEMAERFEAEVQALSSASERKL
jgi:hypothetical protein